MKKLFLLLILGVIHLPIFSQINVSSQGTEILSGFITPSSVKLFGDNLYIADYYSDKLFKIDMTAEPLNATPLLTGVNGIWDIERHGNDLYFTEHYSNKLRKIDLTQENPTPEDVVTVGFFRPTGLLIHNNIAYLTDIANNKLYSVDLTETNPTARLVLSAGLDAPTALERIGNYIYIANNGNSNNKIVRFNLTDPNPVISPVVSNIGLHSIYGLNYRSDGYLYVSRFNGAELVRINPAQNNPPIEQVMFGIRLYDAHFNYKGDDYICGDISGNPVPDSKLFRLDQPLSMNSYQLRSAVSLYPNPSNGLFYLNLQQVDQPTKIRLIDLKGATITEHQSNGKELVRFYEQHLNPGMYLLQVQTANAVTTYKHLITK